MLIIGIDPGISGAICFMEKGRIIDVIDDFYNGIKNDDFKNVINLQDIPEDQNNFGYRLWYKINKKIQKYFKL